MARNTSKLTIEYTAESIADLDKVWDWNAERYGDAHANRYIGFLKNKVSKLLAQSLQGRSRPN